MKYTKKCLHTRLDVSHGLGLCLVGLGLGLASQASHAYLPQIATHTATGEASRVYSISQYTNTQICITAMTAESKTTTSQGANKVASRLLSELGYLADQIKKTLLHRNCQFICYENLLLLLLLLSLSV